MSETRGPLRRTFLHDLHVGLGARMVPFAGFDMPVQYAGILQEHQAARRAAAIFDTGHMAEFDVRGPRALEDLERLVSCDLAALAPGRCRYGLLCNEAGGVLDDLIVYCRAPGHYMLVVNAGTHEKDRDWVQARLSPGTAFRDLSGETAKLDLQGPGAPALAEALLERSIAGLGYFHFMDNRCAGRPVTVSRTGYTGEVGFELYADPETARGFWQRAVAAGALPAGLGARNTLRIEMGMPLYGHELGENRNAAESGFTRAISATKAFIGSSKVLDPGQRRQTLVGVRLDDRRSAHDGDALVDADGRDAGVVTSASFAPSLGVAVVLGYVAAEAGKPGQRLAARGARRDLPGTVEAMPFHRDGTARRPMAAFLGARKGDL